MRGNTTLLLMVSFCLLIIDFFTSSQKAVSLWSPFKSKISFKHMHPIFSRNAITSDFIGQVFLWSPRTCITEVIAAFSKQSPSGSILIMSKYSKSKPIHAALLDIFIPRILWPSGDGNSATSLGIKVRRILSGLGRGRLPGGLWLTNDSSSLSPRWLLALRTGKELSSIKDELTCCGVLDFRLGRGRLPGGLWLTNDSSSLSPRWLLLALRTGKELSSIKDELTCCGVLDFRLGRGRLPYTYIQTHRHTSQQSHDLTFYILIYIQKYTYKE